MSSSAAKKMDPTDSSYSTQRKGPPPPEPLSVERRINMTDNGFEEPDVYADVGDTVIVVGAETMTVTLSVTVAQPSLLSGLSSNPFSVSKGSVSGPFTIVGNGNNSITLTTNLGGGGGGDIVTIHVNP